MSAKGLLRNNRKYGDSKTITVELVSENDAIDIEVEFRYKVDPSESEGGYIYYHGGANLESTQISAFTFEGKQYSEITSDLIGYLDFPTKFKEKHLELVNRAQDETKQDPLSNIETELLVEEYFQFTFDSASDNIDVPSIDYPVTL